MHAVISAHGVGVAGRRGSFRTESAASARRGSTVKFYRNNKQPRYFDHCSFSLVPTGTTWPHLAGFFCALVVWFLAYPLGQALLHRSYGFPGRMQRGRPARLPRGWSSRIKSPGHCCDRREQVGDEMIAKRQVRLAESIGRWRTSERSLVGLDHPRRRRPRDTLRRTGRDEQSPTAGSRRRPSRCSRLLQPYRTVQEAV